MLLTENEQKWQKLINEELKIDDKNKLAWMSKYAQIHEIHESMQSATSVDGGIYSTPLNTLGLGNPMMPTGVGYNAAGQGTGIGDTGADFHNPNYQVGSGDIPMSTLSMALEIAACTIGFELVPVVPATGPWAMLSYMDFPYAGGKLGRINETWADGKGENGDNKPIYIKVPYAIVYATGKSKKDITPNVTLTFTSEDGVFTGKFIGFSRIDNSIIMEVVSAVKGTENVSIADVFGKQVTLSVASTETWAGTQTAQNVKADLVAGAADHVQGFSNFFKDKDGKGSVEPMTRAQNETGVGNTIGARMFTKMVQMGAYEVTGTVTRQQLQDMPLYGIDVVGQVLQAMQNQISQEINNRILDRVFKLGVTNAKIQKEYQGVDLNLYFANAGAAASKDLKDFPAANKFIGIDNQNAATTWGPIQNCIQNTSAENVTTHQRRIMSRLLAGANLIANVSRRGRASWAVTNTQVLSALQDSAAFVVAPMANTLTQGGEQSLYYAGSVANIALYVDPYMLWDDTRVCLGRKSDGNTPGVVFMPYILCDQVSTIIEGTMAPKLLCNSRFAIVDAGFHPEQNYFTFMIDTNGVGII